MALETIISALRTATEAEDLTFYFNDPLTVNETGKEFPCVIISDSIPFRPTEIDRKWVEFNLRMLVYDTFHLEAQKAERDAIQDSKKQSDLVAKGLTIIRAARKALDVVANAIQVEGAVAFTAQDMTSKRNAVATFEITGLTQYDC